MSQLIRKNQFIWLTFALIGLMLTGALSNYMPANQTLELIEYTSLGLLFISLFSLQTRHRWGKGFLFILTLMLVTVIFRGTTESFYFEYFYLFMLLLFMVLAAVLVGSQVLLTGKVDLNIIVGSITLYIMIGYIWSILYTILLEFLPGSLKGIEVGPWYDNLPTTTYFSFVTLTTLGYGDISPVEPVAQVLVILEAVTGMFYIAVIVASLIGAMRNS